MIERIENQRSDTVGLAAHIHPGVPPSRRHRSPATGKPFGIPYVSPTLRMRAVGESLGAERYDLGIEEIADPKWVDHFRHDVVESFPAGKNVS